MGLGDERLGVYPLAIGKALDLDESRERKTKLDRMAARLSRLGGVKEELASCCDGNRFRSRYRFRYRRTQAPTSAGFGSKRSQRPIANPRTSSQHMSEFDLIDNYFCRVCEMPDAELDPLSKALVEVWHSFGLIQNGGLHAYLCSIGDEALNISQQYETVGLLEASKRIRQAYGLWRGYWPTRDPDESDPDEFRSQCGDELERNESEFYGLEDEMLAALAKIVRNRSSEN